MFAIPSITSPAFNTLLTTRRRSHRVRHPHVHSLQEAGKCQDPLESTTAAEGRCAAAVPVGSAMMDSPLQLPPLLLRR